MAEIKPSFTGEMQLAGWSESHTGGCKVTFWLPSPDDLAAFRALTVRKGNTAGHRFMAALVEIGDDEQPIQPPPSVPALQAPAAAPPVLRAHMGDCCYRTVMWCQEPTFWEFLNKRHPNCGRVTNAREAGELVKFLCGIESRKELDADSGARAAWHRLIREPYRLWLLQNPEQ